MTQTQVVNVELNDELLRAARKYADECDLRLEEVVCRALSSYLGRAPTTAEEEGIEGTSGLA